MQRFKSPVVILAIGVLILTIIASAVLAVTKITSNPFSTAPSNTASSKSVSVTQDKALLRSTIKSAFNSKDGAGILAYLDLAFEQKQPLQSYDYLKKTFDKMTASYNSVKAPEKKIAMGKLKVYASNLPEYKESDFAIPK